MSTFQRWKLFLQMWIRESPTLFIASVIWWDKYLSVFFDSNKKLSLLVEQLFQYARLEANLITPQKEVFVLEELISDIIAA